MSDLFPTLRPEVWVIQLWAVVTGVAAVLVAGVAAVLAIGGVL